MAHTIRYEIHHGIISEKFLPRLVTFDVELFRKYPYLFIATPEHEDWYWNAISTESTILILAYDDSTIVGAAVGISTESPLGHSKTLSSNLYQ